MSAVIKDLEPVVAPELGQSATELAEPNTTFPSAVIPQSKVEPTAEELIAKYKLKPEASLATPAEPALASLSTTALKAVTQTPENPPSSSHSPLPIVHAPYDPAIAAAVALEATSTIKAFDPSSPVHTDDGYGSDTGSVRSASVASSIRDYGFENGRRYHKFREGAYQFPNDEPEQEREDMKHAMCVQLTGGKLHFAPLDPTKSLHILDVGTGTGIWCIDMGDEYPSANILGIDLSPIQPGFVPPNVRFMIDDAESSWLHGPNAFDYVHFRHMSPSLKNFPATLARAYSSIKPGGWVELQDLTPEVFCDDESMPYDYVAAEWLMLFAEGLLRIGPDVLAPKRNIERLTAAGFTNIQQAVYKCPIGPWARNSVLRMVGVYERSALFDGAEAMSLGGLVRGLGWSVPEMQVYLVGLRRSLMDASVHSYVYYYNTWGQRPLEG